MIEDDDSIKGEILGTTLSQAEEESLTSKLDWDERLEMWILPASSYSDYSGSMVERSNSKFWLETFPEHVEERSGGHGSSWVGITPAKLATLSPEQIESLIEYIDSVEDYPLLDEEGHSTMENDAQWKDWDENYRQDFRKALMTKFGGYGLNGFAAAYAPNDDLDELLRDNDNGEWEEQDGGTYHINVDRLAKNVTIEKLTGDGKMAKDYRKAKKEVWNGGFADTFADELEARFGNSPGAMAAITKNIGLFDLADSLLEKVNGWAVNDDYTGAENSSETKIVPDMEDLKPALDDMDPSRLTQAQSHVKDPAQLKLKLRTNPVRESAHVIASSLLERSQVIEAPDWLVERMRKVRELPPPTLEKVRQQFEASREQSFKADLPDHYS